MQATLLVKFALGGGAAVESYGITLMLKIQENAKYFPIKHKSGQFRRFMLVNALDQSRSQLRSRLDRVLQTEASQRECFA